MLELTVRLIASLAIVVGLLLLLAKVSGRRMRGRAGSLVQVVHRQPLSRSSAVAVVTVGTRVLVLGTTEHQVQVLTELDPDELEADLVLVPGEDDENGEPTSIPVIVPPTPIAPTQRVQRGGTRKAVTPRAGARKAGTSRAGARKAAPTDAPSSGPLTGSVLSPQTWKQALAAATGKAS
jgi:flagellar protein FliO/FliZ